MNKLTDDELMDAAEKAYTEYGGSNAASFREAMEQGRYRAFAAGDLLAFGRKVEALTIERQAAVNAELLAALTHIEGAALDIRCERYAIAKAAHEAIAKAEGKP